MTAQAVHSAASSSPETGEQRDASPPRYRTPAHRIIAVLGGPRRAAYLAGRDVCQVYRWTYPRAKGGTGGRVPPAAQEALVRATALTFTDFHPRDKERFF